MMLRMLRICVAAALLALWGASASLAQEPETSTPPPAAAPAGGAIATSIADAASSAYVLGRDDVVEVGLLGNNGSGFGGRARVAADGTIQLNFIGKVQAADHTTGELSDTIRKALIKGGFFADPVVTVEVVGYASRYVTVLGAIGNPGLIPINRPYRLSEILARVGGVREGAADYLIVTSAAGKETRYPIRNLATGGPDADPYVQSGDKIYAPIADLLYVNGKVNSPGAFPITAGMTVRMAIAKAGGVNDEGSDKKIELHRGDKKQKVKLDDLVQANDVLTVGERLF